MKSTRRIRSIALILPCALSLLFAHGVAHAQEAEELVGDPHAGKFMWQTLATSSCKNCHGVDGQGGFGPALAGRGLTTRDFINAIRNPILMAEFPQYDDQLMADFAAWLATLPPVEEVAPWRHTVPEGAAPGLVTAFAVGCAQCHGPILETPRHNAAAAGADFEWFKDHVYNHTDVVREYWASLDPPAEVPFMRMGKYDPERLPESVLERIWGWMTDEGLLIPVTAGLSGPSPRSDQATYAATLINRGIPGKGMAAVDVTIALIVPPGARVVAATGDGYAGQGEFEGRNAAVWRLPRIGPGTRLEMRATLAEPPTVLDNVRLAVRWSGGKRPEALDIGVGRRPRSFP